MLHRSIRYVSVLLIVFPLSVHAASGSDELWMMLEKASQAAHKLSYKGIFVYQSGSTVNSMQITHMNYAQGGEFAHLVSLDGQPREVLRQGNEVVIYSPRSEKVLIERRRVQASFPAVLPGLTNMLKVSYQVRNLGFERVGGREAVIVFLEPKDQLRYGYRFYVDKEYGLLLKSVMLNEHGQMLEQVAFNQLVLMNNNNNSQKMDWFRPEVARGKAYIMQPEEKVEPGEAENEVWAIAELPAGFRKVDQILRLMPGKTSPVQQLVFSDGMASVSLFIEPLEKNVEPKQGLVTQGGTSVYALVVDGYQEIVVGEVPEATVRLIADAITFKK